MAVVFPNMSRWYAGMQARQALGVVRGQLLQLPAAAVFTAQDLSLADIMGPNAKVPVKYRVDLPPGWVLTDAGDLKYLRSGICKPGQALLTVTSTAVPVLVRVRLQNALCEMDVAVVAP